MSERLFKTSDEEIEESKKPQKMSFREFVNIFSKLMIEQKELHDKDKGESYRVCSIDWLEGELLRQLSDYFKDKEVLIQTNVSNLGKNTLLLRMHEILSTANICAMIYYRLFVQNEIERKKVGLI